MVCEIGMLVGLGRAAQLPLQKEVDQKIVDVAIENNIDIGIKDRLVVVIEAMIKIISIEAVSMF